MRVVSLCATFALFLQKTTYIMSLNSQPIFNNYSTWLRKSGGCVEIQDLRNIWIKSQIFPLEKEMNLSEWGSLLFFSLPALLHEVPDFPGTVMGVGQYGQGSAVLVEAWEICDDFFISQRFKRLLASEGQDFPKGDTKRPNIALRCKLALEEFPTIKCLFPKPIFIDLPWERIPKPSSELEEGIRFDSWNNHFGSKVGSCRNRRFWFVDSGTPGNS